MNYNKKIESIEHHKDGIDIIYIEPSNQYYLCDPPRPVPDKVYKEIWRVEEGELCLKDTIYGKYEPAEIIPSRISFS